jgi:flagellar biosynthesis protein FlhF
MKMKTFRATTMPQALAQVKSQLGSDAVIMHTRTIKRGGFIGLGSHTVVEITARRNCSDIPLQNRRGGSRQLRRLYASSDNIGMDSGAKTANDIRDKLPLLSQRRNITEEKTVQLPADRQSAMQQNRDDTGIKNEIGQLRGLVENLVREQRQLHAPQMPEQLFDVYLELIQREVADEIAREMITHVQRDMTGSQIMSADLVRQKLVKVMDDMISTAGPISYNLNGRARVVTLIGPTGVGKTTSIAKIAANLKLRSDKKVGLITIDTYRIGAIDQLRMYAQIIDVPLKVVLTPGELKETVESMRDSVDVILIDTAGRSQNDELKIKELKTFIDAAEPDEVHLVLAGTANHSHLLSAADKFKSIGYDRLIFTKLDEVISFGVVLSVLRKVDASVSYITTGQDVPDDIEVAGSRKLARMLLGITDMQELACGYIA